MSNDNLVRVFIAWKTLIQALKKDEIEKELLNFKKQCEYACKMYISYATKFHNLYNCMSYIDESKFKNFHKFLNILKSIDKASYNSFTESHDIANLKEYLSLKEKSVAQGFTILSDLVEYSQFISHLILRVYDEKNEEKQKMLLSSLM